jgi:hypothetical protein
MNVLNLISKGQLVGVQFMQDNLAASQTDVQLFVAEVASAAGILVDEICMPWDGEIVGISYDLSSVGSAGSFTVGATINGTENADTTQTITTAQRGAGKVAREKAKFVAGDYIGVEVTTASGWNGTTADLVATVWVLLHYTDP